MNAFRLSAASLFWLLVSGCGSEVLELDTTAPQLLSVYPNTTLRSEGEAIELHFSEPVLNVKKGEACFRLAKSDEVSANYLLAPVKVKSLDKSGVFVPLSARFSERSDILFLTPSDKLEFERDYSLWLFDCLRDYAGNALALNSETRPFLEIQFKVESGPFELISQDVLSNPDARVPPNRKYFHFSFSHKIEKLPENPVLLDGQTLKYSLSEDKLTLRAVLGDKGGTCERMTPDAPHTLELAEGITDERGRVLIPRSFKFLSERACLQRKANMIGRPRVFAYESHVEFAFDSTLLTVAKLRFGLNGTTLDCMGQSCPVFVPQLLPRGKRLSIESLASDKLYRYEFDVEDLYGEHALLQGQFETRRMALIAVNEIMANPKIAGGGRESAAEYIELYNYGDDTVDLSRFSVEVGSKTCPLSDDSTPLLLQGRSYLLLVGSPFNSELFGLIDGPEIHRMQGQTICGNLRNWPLPTVVLRDDRNRVLDEFVEMSRSKGEGFSIERLNAEAKNEKGQFCYSRKDIGPTPLGENGVVRKGCEQE